MNDWISVKDRFPDPPTNDCDHLSHLVTDGKTVHQADFVYFSPWTWILPYKMQNVTHWMPLPDPPKE